MEKFHVWMIGCQYNEHDAIRVSHMLKKLGFSESSAEEADFIIILACSVRQTAIDRIFGKLKHWPDKRVIITACVLPADRKRFAQRGVLFWDIQKPKELAKILGIEDLREIKKFMNEGRNLSCYVPIMIGCNNFCSYCAVPLTRGRETSVPFDAVVKQVENLVARGVKNITLLGQNVNSYTIGQNSKIKSQKSKSKLKSSKSDFTMLLEKLNALPGDFSIAFTSNHPKDMTNDIIEAVATLAKIKKEIHLPLQSGSNKILKLMNRPYTAEEYLRLVESIKLVGSPKAKGWRGQDERIKITTDVIVGFPGETEEDFQKTVEVFKKIKFSLAYINKYSPRSGTAAYKLGDPISWAEKQRRWHELNSLIANSVSQKS